MKSYFLFGPRSTGKSTLIDEQLKKDAIIFDLLERDTYKRLLDNPSLLSQVDLSKIIVIDEIQKIPSLLDEVHRIIQRHGTKFLLTGSSARKIKRGGANLLAGRAWETFMFPLVSEEIPNFDLERYLTRGGLPQVVDSEYWQKELKAYVSLYLREEIVGEALTRNIEAFSEFLDLVAKSNGNEINYQGFASDCGVSLNTIKSYFEILEDTLIGVKLPAYTKTKKRKAITRAKHYLFDPGIVNAICDQGEVTAKSQAFGGLFEQFIFLETRAANVYLDYDEKLTYWRSTSQQEVDLIIGDKLAIEVKGTSKIHSKHMKGLRALKEEGLIENYMVVSLDTFEQKSEDGIRCLHWKDFLDLLWAKKLF
jgi:predicted AAA+ superfamily ATPase